MAFVYQEDDEQTQESQQSAAAPQGSQVFGQTAAPIESQAQNTVSSSAQIGAGGSTSSQGTAPQRAPQGTGFQNIQGFLDQNREQAQGLAQQVGGKVSSTIDQAKQNISGLQNQFQQQVEQGTARLDNDLINQVKQNAVGVAQNKTQADQFKNLLNAQYRGPNSLADTDAYYKAQEDIRKAKDKAALARSEQGRGELLKSVQTTPRQTQGITNLNNFLLQQTPEASNILNQAAQGAEGLDQDLQGVYDQSKNIVGQAKQASSQVGQQVRDQFLGDQGYINQILAELDQRAAQTKQNQQALALQQQQEIQKALASGQLNDQQLGLLGLSADDINKIKANSQQFNRNVNVLDAVPELMYGRLGDIKYSQNYQKQKDLQDLTKYFKPIQDASNVSRQNVVTDEDYAKQQALLSLLGESDFYLPTRSTGPLQNDFVDFDIQKYLRDAEEQQKIIGDLTRGRGAASQWDNPRKRN